MESIKHIKLVEVIKDYVFDIIPAGNESLVIQDSAGHASYKRLIGNYIPDIYYSYKNLMIIGEAKTSNDLLTKHSKNQYDSYLKECLCFDGKSIIVVAVPWEMKNTARNYFCKIKKDSDIDCEIVIINELGKIDKI